MAEVAKGIIDIEINTGSAASALQALQSQINAFNLALNKGNKTQSQFSGEYSRKLQEAINKTGLFTAETIKLQTAAATLDKTLSKGKTSLGQYFSARFNKDGAIAAETMALASERARRLQTQFIATSGAANGFQSALAVRPLAAFSTEMAVAGQRAEVMSAMFKQGTTQLINFGKNVQWAGRQLMVGFTVPLTIFGAVAGKTFMELEKQAVAFKKVYGDIFTTPAELNQNLEAVKGLASEYTKYGIAVKDTIGLAAQAAAAGRKNADLTDAVSQATRLATLGQMDQNAALETTISLQSAFRLSGKDLADTINFLNMVENQTVVSLQDIAAAIPRVAPVIQGLGGNVKDLTVFLAAMQEGGVDAAEGANALKSGLASLINPTKQATEMLNGMGVNLETIIQANKGDLMGTVQAFAQALSGLDQFSRQQALEQVFGKFQYAKLGALFDNISRKGSQAQQVIATMGYSTEQLGATADKELKTIEESFGVQLTGAIERFKLAIAPIGEIFVKLAIPLVNFATKIAEAFNGLSDGQKKFAAIGAVVVGVVVPAVTMLTGLFLNLVGTLAKMTQGATLFAKGLITGGPIGAMKALTQSSKYLSLAEMDAAMAAQQLAGANEVLNATLVKQVGSSNAAAAAIGNLTKAYAAMIATQGAAAGRFPEVFGVAGAAGTAAKSSQVRIRGIQRRNSGGQIFMSNGTTVPGTGNTDTVPAMLTPGEFVVNKEATKNNLGLLNNINDSKKPQGLNVGGKTKGIQYLMAGKLVKGMFDDILGGFGSLGSSSQVVENIATIATRKVSKTGLRLPKSFANQIITKRKLERAKFGGANQLGTGGSSGRSGSSKRPAIGPAPGERGYSSYKESDIDRILGPEFDAFGGPKARSALISKLFKKPGQKTSSYLFGHAGSPEYFEHARRIGLQMPGNKNAYPRGAVSQLQGKLFNFTSKDIEENLMLDVLPKTGSIIPRSTNTPMSRGSGADKSLFGNPQWYDELELIDFLKKQEVPVKKIREIAGRVAANKKRLLSESEKITEAKWGQIQQQAEDAALLYLNLGGKVPGFNRGNIVPGTGNTDTVPAMLTPGEFVVNKEATKNNLGLLHQINNSQKLNKGGIAYKGSNEAPPRLAMNVGGAVQYLNEGGGVGKARVAGQAGSIAGGFAGFALAEKLGIEGMAGQFITSLAAGTVAQKALTGSILAITKSTKAAGAKEALFPMLSKLGPTVARFALPLTLGTAAFAAVGFTLYKLNKSLVNAEKSGAALSDAMYGSAKTTKAMADAFGRETYATAARRKAAEKSGGQEITDEAVAASGEFMKSDAARGIVDDIKLVQKSGGDAVLALRNQLASSIIAGVITPEEARAIALDVGKELGSATLGVQVSGELTSLIGPNGEKILDNVIEITADISPKIDSREIQKDAQSAFDSLNVGEKFVQFFKGGKDTFIENFSIDEISAKNASALTKEAEARALLNLAYQEGTITLQEYLDAEGKITSGSNKRSKFVEDANAQALGFSSLEDMNSALDRYVEVSRKEDEFASELSRKIREEGYIPTAEDKQRSQFNQATADPIGKKAYDAIVKKSKDTLKQSFVDSGMDEGMATTKLDDMFGVSQVDPRIFEKLSSGQMPLQGMDVLVNLESTGNLQLEDIERIGKELTALTTIPKIDKVINFETANEEMITEAYDAYIALEKEPEIFKGLNIKDSANLALDTMSQFGINYQWIMSLPNQEKFIVLTTIERHVKLREEAVSGDRVDRLALGQSNADMTKLREETVLPPTGPTGPTGNGGKGGDAKNKFEDLKNMLMQRFKLQEMLIDKEAEAVNKRIKGISREIELQQRQVALEEKQIEVRQKALEELSKKEEEVNTTYDNRISALDRVSASNSRLANQEQSRISFASALASGDIAGAASAMSEMTQQSAENQIEDSRTALETQRETALKNLTVDVNGTLMTRKGIEESIETIQKSIDTIQTSIYDKNLLMQVEEDKLLNIEDKRLKVAEDREKIETRLYLLEQKKAYDELNKKKNKKKLTPEEKAALNEYKTSYNAMATLYNQQNPNTQVQLLNRGGMVSGIGMTDKVPAMLTPGEFVVRKNAAKAFLPALQSINSGLFPSIGGMNLDSPRYDVPTNNVTNVPVSNSITNSSNASTMYNNSYSINVNVSGSSSSADEIANVVMGKIARSNSGSIRGSRY